MKSGRPSGTKKNENKKFKKITYTQRSVDVSKEPLVDWYVPVLPKVPELHDLDDMDSREVICTCDVTRVHTLRGANESAAKRRLAPEDTDKRATP